MLLTDDPNSQVWGNIQQGVFEGVIKTSSDGTFYVEKAHHYFPEHNTSNTGFHSVIYHDRDIHDPYASIRKGHDGSGCGLTDDVAEWMESVQYGADNIEEVNNEKPDGCKGSGSFDEYEFSNYPQYKEMFKNLASYKYIDNYDKLAKQLKRDFQHKYGDSANRVKRSFMGVGADNRGTCTLSIQTDPMLWHHLHDKVCCIEFVELETFIYFYI